MATRATLGYIDGNGEFRGTYVNFDGTSLEGSARERFETEGYEALVKWVEAGIAGGGYSSVSDAEPYGDGVQGVITASEYFGSRWLEYAVVVWEGGARSLEEHLYMRLQADRAFRLCWTEAARGGTRRSQAEMYARTVELAEVQYDDQPELRDCVIAECQRRQDDHRRMMSGYTGD